jgi:hypothetical protein
LIIAKEENIMEIQEVEQIREVEPVTASVATPDGVTFLPVYVPTIEETVKASGGHRQVT